MTQPNEDAIRAEERTRIVAWLRAQADRTDVIDIDGTLAITRGIADMIERGDWTDDPRPDGGTWEIRYGHRGDNRVVWASLGDRSRSDNVKRLEWYGPIESIGVAA